MSQYGTSERRTCRLLNFSRRANRYQKKEGDFNQRLTAAMLRLVKSYPRYGYKKITRMLINEGWRVNRKRVYRLWKAEGLKVPTRKKVPRNKGHSTSSVSVRPSQHINHVWSWDFVSGSTATGKELRWLVVVDEFTRESLLLEPRHSWKSDDVVEAMLGLMSERAIPLCIRSDNGPELVARKLRETFERLGIELLYIEAGSPWQNGYCESFNAIFRDECLNEHNFANLGHAARVSQSYQQEYNTIRPHGSLGHMTPSEYARGVINNRPLRIELSCGSATRAAIDNPAVFMELNNNLELSN